MIEELDKKELNREGEKKEEKTGKISQSIEKEILQKGEGENGKEGEKEVEVDKKSTQEVVQIDVSKKKSKKKIFFFVFLVFSFLSLIGVVIVIYFFLSQETFFVVSVQDEKTAKILTDVPVQVGDQSVKTDAFGKARFDNLKPGTYQIKVSLEGYDQTEKSVVLQKGDNGEETVTLDLILFDISGSVKDYIDKASIEKAKITLDQEQKETDAEGKFVFEDMLPRQVQLTLEKEGYLKKTLSLTISQDEDWGNFHLIPDDRAIFVSSRDGDKAIYKGYLDGEGIEKLWENKEGFDDHNANLSPNDQYITFFSTRDGEEDNYGDYLDKLYVNSISGGDFSKVSNEAGNVAWWDDSSGFVCLNSSYENGESSSVIEQYKLVEKKLSRLFDDTDFETVEASSSASLSDLKMGSSDRMIFKSSNWEEPGYSGIYKAEKNGKNLTKLTDKQPYNLYLTPDREKIRFMYYQNQSAEHYEINVTTGKEKQIPFDHRTGKSLGKGYFNYEEEKSPDGVLKAYIDYRDGKNDLYVSDLSDNNERRLSYIGGVNNFEFANDGKYIVFYSNLSQATSIYAVGLQSGNEPIKITDVVEFVGVIEN